MAIEATEQVLDQSRLVAGWRQIDQLSAFAKRWRDRRWDGRGAAGLGRLSPSSWLVLALGSSTCVRLWARVRMLSGGSARKTDSHDARSPAIVALHGRRLHQVALEGTTATLQTLADRRDHLSRERHRIICKLHNRYRDYAPEA